MPSGSVTEKVPVARWRVDGITFVVDGSGEQIGEDRGGYTELPLVVGLLFASPLHLVGGELAGAAVAPSVWPVMRPVDIRLPAEATRVGGAALTTMRNDGDTIST